MYSKTATYCQSLAFGEWETGIRACARMCVCEGRGEGRLIFRVRVSDKNGTALIALHHSSE